MVAPYLQKACILTAIVCLLATPLAAADPGNADDGGLGGSKYLPPCEIVLILLEPPFVEVHEECIPDLP